MDRWRCNRGLPIYIRTSNDVHQAHCFCPPSYYGDACQYQNQRVSLTVQVRVTSDWRQLWIFILTLVDNEENIQSYDHMEYFPARDCKIKFNIYLLYSTRPKNSSKNYTVRIHGFNKGTLKYRASWIFPIRFAFLPVYRLAALLIVPFTDNQPVPACTPACVHGRCFRHVNDVHSSFCLCDSGWAGVQCDLVSKCQCALGSLCLAGSICVCPLERFGPRCSLQQSSCSPGLCLHGGQCISADPRYNQGSVSPVTCICSERHMGDRCQYQQTRIDISFHPDLALPTFLLIHFIRAQHEEENIRTTTMKKLLIHENSLSFYTEIEFHLAIAEVFGNYYLLILQEQSVRSANVSATILPSHRCRSIHEVFDQVRSRQHLIRRIKYYHIACNNTADLVCFYDAVHICLCNLDRQANCFRFDHNVTYDCYGYNYCENNGQCFRDGSDCPKSSSCACRDCYFGSRCQFSTQGSSLSLDMILGYNINPNSHLIGQSLPVRVSIALTSILFFFGSISNLLSFLTFRMKSTRSVGCGFYLLASSITSLLALVLLTIKVGLLLASQMNAIDQRSFLHVQCITMDFFIRFILSSIDWLSACVAIERAINVVQGIRFNSTKAVQVAKRIILSVFLFTAITGIHDPLHRHLVDDEEEQRTWCVVKYSSSLQMFDRAMNIIHFSIPFGTNCISALIIIIFAARAHSAAQKDSSYKQILREQFRLHKHLLISPFLLVLLASPRLILSFLTRCMKSARNPWAYLIGYFISFIPAMLTFIVFVLPSELYTKELKNSIKRFG